MSVKDLNKSIEFFTNLGFEFNQQFTDENATCMIINESTFAMLLVEKFFKSFITKEITDTAKNAEVINALATTSREKVDEMIAKVLEAGGSEPRPSQDHGWMYQRSFQDVDGHLWEIFWMDERKMPTQ